jgi:hypothetical protein
MALYVLKKWLALPYDSISLPTICAKTNGQGRAQPFVFQHICAKSGRGGKGEKGEKGEKVSKVSKRVVIPLDTSPLSGIYGRAAEGLRWVTFTLVVSIC